MDTIKKILHPNQEPSSHHDDTNTNTNTTSQHPHTHADAATTAALGSEPNVTGTDRPAPTFDPAQHHHPQHPQQQQQQENKIPRAGHHHPLQPVGATGLPPNHRPREDFMPKGGSGSGGAQGGAGAHQTDAAAAAAAAAAEAGNNFPGTNPHPAHSALGNANVTGERGSVMPGRE